MVVLKMGGTFYNIDKNVFSNILDMKEIILPFQWHSFCISIDLTANIMILYHNDHIQAWQNFTITHNDMEGISQLMTKGHLGGPKFAGFIADLQVFRTALPEDIIFKWTSCQIQAGFVSLNNLNI